jgi:hypothetical protein
VKRSCFYLTNWISNLLGSIVTSLDARKHHARENNILPIPGSSSSRTFRESTTSQHGKMIVPNTVSTKRYCNNEYSYQLSQSPNPLFLAFHYYLRPLTLPLRDTSPGALLTDSLLLLSILRLILALELLRLARRTWAGSKGCNPEARANRFNISVRLTTPASRPESVDAEFP